MTPFLWVLLATVGWSGFDVARKRLAETTPAAPLIVALMMGLAPCFGLWLVQSPQPWPTASYWQPASLTIAVNTLANVLFIHAVARSAISVTIPMLSFTPVFSAAAGAVLLDESVNAVQGVGIATVFVGAFVIQGRDALRPSRWDMGSLEMIGVAMLWSLASVFDKQAVLNASPPLHGFVLSSGVGLVLGTWVLLRGNAAAVLRPRAMPGWYVFGVGAAMLALGAQLVALQSVTVSELEATKRAVGMAFAVIVGRLMWAEPVTSGKVLGIVTMAVGVALVLQVTPSL